MVLINTSGKLEGRGDSTYGGSEEPAACGGEFIMKAVESDLDLCEGRLT